MSAGEKQPYHSDGNDIKQCQNKQNNIFHKHKRYKFDDNPERKCCDKNNKQCGGKCFKIIQNAVSYAHKKSDFVVHRLQKRPYHNRQNQSCIYTVKDIRNSGTVKQADEIIYRRSQKRYERKSAGIISYSVPEILFPKNRLTPYKLAYYTHSTRKECKKQSKRKYGHKTIL